MAENPVPNHDIGTETRFGRKETAPEASKSDSEAQIQALGSSQNWPDGFAMWFVSVFTEGFARIR